MLIGAHVSTAGGLDKAVGRGVDIGCEAIQIFNQSPRMWRPTNYAEDDFASFRESMDDSPIEAVVIHAVYLINCATNDPELREKSLAALTHALRIGDAIGASGVVLHPGSQKDQPLDPSLRRAGQVIAEALAETDHCPLLIEQTAGHKGLLARDFDEVATLIGLAGGGDRLGLCLDSCHMFVQGMDITDQDRLTEILDEADETVGLERLRCVHVNDAAVPLGSHRDRHANVGQGEMGKNGLAAFLSEPRFEGLPATLETPGPDKKGSDRSEVDAARKQRAVGLRRRAAARKIKHRGGTP